MAGTLNPRVLSRSTRQQYSFPNIGILPHPQKLTWDPFEQLSAFELVDEAVECDYLTGFVACTGHAGAHSTHANRQEQQLQSIQYLLFTHLKLKACSDKHVLSGNALAGCFVSPKHLPL